MSYSRIEDFPEKIERLVKNVKPGHHDKIKMRVSEKIARELARVPLRGYWGTQCLFSFKDSTAKVLSKLLSIRDNVDDQLASCGLDYYTVCGIDFVRLRDGMVSQIS